MEVNKAQETNGGDVKLFSTYAIGINRDVRKRNRRNGNLDLMR